MEIIAELELTARGAGTAAALAYLGFGRARWTPVS